MRAALMTAYSVDTIVQYDVAWNQQVSAAADGYIELFGKVEAALNGSYVFNGTNLDVTTAAPHGLSKSSPPTSCISRSPRRPDHCARQRNLFGDRADRHRVHHQQRYDRFGPRHLDARRCRIPASPPPMSQSAATGPSPLTFMFGNPDVASAATVSFDLRYDVTNLQYFLAPDTGTPGEARPSIWLQLVDPLQPHIGPDGTPTEIPVVFRQYPTPPTLISQSWTKPPAGPASANPLADDVGLGLCFHLSGDARRAGPNQQRDHLQHRSQAAARNNKLRALDASGAVRTYSLFPALARFSAVYGVIQGILPTLSDASWGAAIEAFADSMGDVVSKTRTGRSCTSLNATKRSSR